MDNLLYKNRRLLPVWSLSLFLLLLFSPRVIAAEFVESSKFMALGTGTTSGVFYPVGMGICQILNEDRLEHGYRCLAYPTGAAVNNILAIETGDLDLGITYESLLDDARNGVGYFAGVPAMPELRFVASLYKMPAVVIVNREIPIKKVTDLLGLRIDIGNVGSGKRTIAETLFTAMNWKPEYFESVTDYDSTEVKDAFCSGDVDVIVEAMSENSAFLNKMTSECNGRIIHFDDEAIDLVKSVSPGLGSMIIPGGKYPNNPDEVQTISINSVLASSARVNPAAIYTLTEEIFGKFKKFNSIHSALQSIAKSDMVKREKSIPFHEGALNFYKTQGFKDL